ncbi:MAG: hypothetical protein AAF961_01660 [Planctomycetota bacterium]
MSKKKHSHGHHEHGHSHRHKPKQGLHKDWRSWVVVGLMLAAMVVYVLSMDESIAPGEPPGDRPPVEAIE